jgi:hypothetical protein
MAPPTMTAPATILSFFIIFLLKNSASSGGVSDGDPPDAAEYGVDSDPPATGSDAGECGVDIGTSENLYRERESDDNNDGWCEGVNLSDG